MDYVEIYAGNWEKNNNKNLLFLLFLKDNTISTKTYYFKEWTTILHYQQHKNLLFSTIYICPHFVNVNLIFYITNILLTFLKLQKH